MDTPLTYTVRRMMAKYRRWDMVEGAKGMDERAGDAQGLDTSLRECPATGRMPAVRTSPYCRQTLKT
jgi:hypothetical protein